MWNLNEIELPGPIDHYQSELITGEERRGASNPFLFTIAFIRGYLYLMGALIHS